MSFHHSAASALTELSTLEHAVVVSDRNMPMMDGTEFCRQARKLSEHIGSQLEALYFIILSGCASTSHITETLEAGADDYLTKPCVGAELVARIRVGCRNCALMFNDTQLQRELRKAATIDPLTGLSNRRGAADRIAGELARVHRGQQALAVAICDLDDFKAVNDSHGHCVGDLVLARFGEALRRELRGYDLAVRWGGEEFVIVFPGVDTDTAIGVLDRIRRGLDAIPVTSEVPVSIRFSAGVSCVSPADETSFECMLERADEALYEAKARGKARSLAFVQ